MNGSVQVEVSHVYWHKGRVAAFQNTPECAQRLGTDSDLGDGRTAVLLYTYGQEQRKLSPHDEH